jgi:hypothetical protein
MFKPQQLPYFVSLGSKVFQTDTVDERTNFLVEEYSTSGRLDNITQVMSLHTPYLESFLRSQFYMLRMDGPLPLPHRHYIAVMVGASGPPASCFHATPSLTVPSKKTAVSMYV